MNIKKFVKFFLFGLGAAGFIAMQPVFASVNVTVQPASQVSFIGTNVNFTAQVSTTGGETITSYTWKFSSNNLPPFNVVAGATTSTLTVTNTQLTNSGFYFVSLTYNSGTNIGLTAVSVAANLIVHDQARITSQPQGGFIRATGASASFSVSALGEQPISYQWRQNGTNLVEGGRIVGSTSNSVTINNLITNDTGGYDVVVSNIYTAVTSQVASITVYVPPLIIVQPTNLAVVIGSNAVFQVVEGGALPLSFQWQKNGVILTNGGRISGATNDTLVIASTVTNDNGNYSVTITNIVGITNSIPATLTVLIPPVITSATNTKSQQGFPFTYTATATGSTPITFGAQGLPAGLGIDPVSGVISGIPSVFGIFNVTLFATNAARVAATNLQITLITDVPGITSTNSVNGQQGQPFTYAITASNNPVTFTVTALPVGINFNPVTGVISGVPLYSSTNVITIGVANQYGSDSRNVTLNIATAVPIITSPLVATGVENDTNFVYTITASNSPTVFGAAGLPRGLTINTNTGVISGALTIGGTNNVLIWAANAYGTGSNLLQLAVSYAPLNGLAITDVSFKPGVPYLLDFTFSLRDDPNAVNNSALGNAVLRPPEQIQVQCFEGDVTNQIAVPIPTETAFIVDKALNKELLKTFFVMDYSYSMLVTPDAIPDMQASIEGLINEEPLSAQFGIYEFSADYVAPKLVTGFTSDKKLLTQTIEGIQTNFVNGDYGGTRLYDALAASLTNFTSAVSNEEHFLILLSDGYDDSSQLTVTNGTLDDAIVNLAKTNAVKIYCVGFGPNPNTNVLLDLTTRTQGRYYAAATPADLQTQFALLLKDLDSQYVLRWATLQRGSNAFQPMFTVTVDGITAQFNTSFSNGPAGGTNTNTVPVSLVGFYTNQFYSNNVKIGALTMFADAATNASSVTLNAYYVPRFVREIEVHYRPNYPCTPVMLSSGPGDFLQDWNLAQTNDGSNGFFLTITSPDTNNLLTSIPYGIMGDLVNFQFKYQALSNAQQAFSLFSVVTNIYSNMPPGGQTFTLTNTAFVTNYAALPPFGTPVPWLLSYGYTNNPTNAELIVTNGMPLWQWYLLGLDPRNPSNAFVLPPVQAPQNGGPPLITFNTAVGRTYRVDAAVTLGAWVTLQDNIVGTGLPTTIADNRDLSGVSSMFYRVVAFY